jgi:hypothetical protein
MAKRADVSDEVFITKVGLENATFCILGTSPLICNRLSEKARHELLMPKGKKTAAEKAGSLKHDPLQEYRSSPYTTDDDDAPTRIELLASMFKGAMKTAALDIPGAKKTQIGRLVNVIQDRVSLYGVPQIFSTIVRSADMNRTPDVRTRAIIPKWACKVNIRFVSPIIRMQSVVNLLAAGGMTSGVGDFRPEKGAGNYGAYEIVADDHPEFVKIMKTGGLSAQDEALDDPKSYDKETDDLLAWFNVEVKRRGFKVA